MAKEININLIPKEKLALANLGDHIKDQKFDDKPIGYFKDAWRRFCKNKASIVAAIIILIIVVFAIVMPFFDNGTGTNFDTYYAKKTSRNFFLSQFGIATGDVEKDYNERAYINEVAKGLAATGDWGSDRENNPITLGAALDTENALQPITKFKEIKKTRQGEEINNIYYAMVDEYVSVGFIYKQVSYEELERMKEWEADTGYQLLYPLIDTKSEYCLDPDDANWWYKTDSSGNPVNVVKKGTREFPVKIEYEDVEDIVLEDNYLRYTSGAKKGQLRYDRPQGGGSTVETAEYQVRVLYYNYYRYTHDNAEPEFLFGTDVSGYDLAQRIAMGLRLSLLFSVCIFIINFILGAMYGAIEGYYGGTPDLVMEFIVYILSGVPFIVVSTLFQIHLAAKVGAIPSLLFAFVMTGWIGTAGLVRTQFYRFKNQEYVMAARTLGAKDSRIIWKHIFPNTLGTIITSSVLAIPGVIFSESMLTYLGIVNLNSRTSTSLGTVLAQAEGTWTEKPHVMLFPALFISLLMICFNLFGNGLRDAFNPSLRGTEE
ncbi:MAG: ABC transporter permease [Ruminococcaceae bacterium]|nr:ABC transporter permease [Oscillospiraceae bacterium]